MVQILPPKKLSGAGQFFQGLTEQTAKTLSQQLPKYIEQGLLKQGLKSFEQESDNLSPMQQLTRLSSIPGITPQMIQSYSDLAKHQGTRNAFNNRAFQGEMAQAANQRQMAPSINQVAFGPQGPQALRGEEQPLAMQSQSSQGLQNPLREEALPVPAWTQEQRDADIANELNKNPYLGIEEATRRSSDNERRYIDRVRSQQEKDKYIQEQVDFVDKIFDKDLQTKLQKDEKGVFKDVTGEMLQNTKKMMHDDLILNQGMSPEKIANKWSDRLLDISKAKTQLQGLASQGIMKQLTSSGERFKKLNSYQKIFSEAGNLEEYYNLLQSDFDMSPQGAASIAYPISKDVGKYINEYEKNRNISGTKNVSGLSLAAKKLALQVENSLKDSDSILAVAKRMTDLYPSFDESSFFEQLTQDLDTASFNPRQKREIAQGKKDFLPAWGDVWFSQFRSKK